LFERIGIGAILTFDEKAATAAMGRARVAVEKVKTVASQVPAVLNKIGSTSMRVFRTMQQGAVQVGAGFGKMRQGIMSAALGLGAITLGVGAAGKMFADFEQQMSVVKSVTNFTGASFEQLSSKAKELGATTAFTATEAAQGMEYLGRAGFTAGEQIDASRHALNLAAADSIELGTSADIMAQVIRGMALSAEKDSQRVADVLAKTSASANTNVISLGESFKYASATAMQMDISLEETAAILATMSDAGLRGTLAGTSFTNMMIKLSKPSEKAQDLLKQLNIDIVRFTDKTGKIKIDFPKTIESISKGLQKIEDPLERAGASAELFGLRGQKAANAFAVAGATKLTGLTESLMAAEGHAQQMADTRLDNFHGQITLLKSAVEGFAIELFGVVMSPLTGILKNDIIPGVMTLVGAFQALNAATTEEDVQKAQEKFGETTVAIVVGIKNGVQAVKDAFDFIVKKVKEWGAAIDQRFGPDTISKVVKWVTVFALIAAAVVPIILALITVGFVISGLVSIISGVASVISGAFYPVLVIAAILGVAFLMLREENESFMETARRVWGNIKVWALDVYHNAILPFWAGVKEAYELLWPELQNTITEAFAVIKEAILHVYGIFSDGTEGVATDWRGAGHTVVAVLAAVIDTIVTTIKWIVLIATTAIRVGRQVFFAIVDTIISPFYMVYNAISDVLTAIGMIFSGDVVGGLKLFGTAVLNFMLAPLRYVMRQLVRLSDMLDEDIVPQAIRDFANEGTISIQQLDMAPMHTQGKRGMVPFLEKKEAVADAAAEVKTEEQNLLDDILAKGQAAAADGIGAKLDDQTKALTDAMADQPCIDNTTTVNLDGSEVARAHSRHQQELKDRAGFKATPYQRRMAAEHGATNLSR
jgi:TP901 family phage tail tape measure protein